MPSKYKSAPLIEVIAEFHFAQADFDLTLPGRMLERLKDEFPRHQQVSIPQLLIAGQPIIFGPQTTQQQRVQFIREDESAMVQIDRTMLIVNHLRPYEDWNMSFLPVLKSAWSAYEELSGSNEVRALKLRYLNRIELPITGNECRYEDYLEFRPHIGAPLKGTHGPFMLAVSFMHREQHDWLNVFLQIERVTEDKGDLLLSLEYSTVNMPPAPPEYMGWFDAAHGHIGSKFEQCINDRLRDRFGRV